ncbi:hypothetical protein SZ29_13350 [Burkholderia pseudomallei]|nr:hypothetical protein SZ29_13350 [Burkholderia pseudomallei]
MHGVKQIARTNAGGGRRNAGPRAFGRLARRLARGGESRSGRTGADEGVRHSATRARRGVARAARIAARIAAWGAGCVCRFYLIEITQARGPEKR